MASKTSTRVCFVDAAAPAALQLPRGSRETANHIVTKVPSEAACSPGLQHICSIGNISEEHRCPAGVQARGRGWDSPYHWSRPLGPLTPPNHPLLLLPALFAADCT